MARYTGPKHRLARREGVNLLDKSSASLQRRLNIKPGMHGAKKSRRRLSEYGLQLREKQKAKTMYGVLERQFKRLVTQLEKQKGDTSELMLSLLETFEDMLVIPAAATTLRTAPPAIIPDPLGAGLSITRAPPTFTSTLDEIVPLISGTVIICFLARSIPLRTAPETSGAFPSPTPTFPLPSPTTVRAERLEKQLRLSEVNNL